MANRPLKKANKPTQQIWGIKLGLIQGWEFAHQLIAHCSFTQNRSRQKSDHDKKSESANRSFFMGESLIPLSLTKNKWFAQKNLNKIVLYRTFWKVFWNFFKFAHSLFFGERCEKIAQVAHQKWANRWFYWANGPFAHFFPKKRAIRSENRWANSQPWFNLHEGHYLGGQDGKQATEECKQTYTGDMMVKIGFNLH